MNLCYSVFSMPQNHLRPLKRAMAIEEAEISSGSKFMEKASVEVMEIGLSAANLTTFEYGGAFEFFGISYDGIRAMIVGLGEDESSEDESSGDDEELQCTIVVPLSQNDDGR
ncbi:hypothetical protein RHMOL_Rhmol07G0149800 [Rhododendron molle]|uniref:Uncharacterized protein n=1 Tax=Rhododendron molle TaxID=49168 RepID=A0ACC0N1V7_RHOML|nr:hypothetical protein RHMOL_Rhmol07G0149800 [Rhododendron molle]